MLVDEVLGGLGPFGQDNIIYPFFGDLQATQIKAWETATTKDRGTGREKPGTEKKRREGPESEFKRQNVFKHAASASGRSQLFYVL